MCRIQNGADNIAFCSARQERKEPLAGKINITLSIFIYTQKVCYAQLSYLV